MWGIFFMDNFSFFTFFLIKGEEDEIMEDDNVPIIKPQTGDSIILPYVVLLIISIISIALIHKKK